MKLLIWLLYQLKTVRFWYFYIGGIAACIVTLLVLFQIHPDNEAKILWNVSHIFNIFVIVSGCTIVLMYIMLFLLTLFNLMFPKK